MKTCCHCGKETDDYYELNDKFYCEDCYEEHTVYCHDCENLYDVDDTYTTVDGEIICRNCFDEGYLECNSCHQIFNNESVYDYGYTYYCENCYNEKLNELGIHNHSYRPDAMVFYECENENSNRMENLHVGIELEIQGRHRDKFCKALRDKYGEDIFYLKMDGSLDDLEGVEIVSHPMSYKFIKNEEYFKTLFTYLDNMEMNNTCGCGLHFHIDKEFCGSPEIVSAIDYIVNEFSDYFQKIGGRSYNEYSEFCKKVNKDFAGWGKRNYTRYCAVNLENRNTVELRFCKSTSNYGEFLNRVKMIFGIIYFAKTHKLKDIYEWSIIQFVDEFDKVCKKLFGSKVEIY